MQSNQLLSLDIGAARRRLEVWRKGRRRGKRIPDELWAVAAALARTPGVSPVAQQLGLDYYGLKRRAATAPAARPAGVKPPAGFIELPLLGPAGQVPTCTVELARGAQARLTIRWTGPASLDLVGLAAGFWRAGA